VADLPPLTYLITIQIGCQTRYSARCRTSARSANAAAGLHTLQGAGPTAQPHPRDRHEPEEQWPPFGKSPSMTSPTHPCDCTSTTRSTHPARPSGTCSQEIPPAGATSAPGSTTPAIGARWGFRVESAALPLAKALAEDYVLEDAPDGCTLHWTVGVWPHGPAALARPVVIPALKAFAGMLARGVEKAARSKSAQP